MPASQPKIHFLAQSLLYTLGKMLASKNAVAVRPVARRVVAPAPVAAFRAAPRVQRAQAVVVKVGVVTNACPLAQFLVRGIPLDRWLQTGVVCRSLLGRVEQQNCQ